MQPFMGTRIGQTDSARRAGGISMKKELLAVCVAATAFAAEEAFSPALTWQGTRGLTQTQSAEPLGEGRLSVSLKGSAFIQKDDSTLNRFSIPKNATLATFQGAFSYGLNSGVDLFGTVTAYGVEGGDNAKGIGAGSVGMKLCIPFEEEFPLRLGVMGQAIGGFAGKQLVENRVGNAQEGVLRPDGYNYFETRTGYDFQALGLASLVFGNEDIKIRLHGNGGLASSVESGTPKLALMAAGLEIAPGRYVSLGFEGNYRTQLDKPNGKDPLWITPSLYIKTPVGFNLHAGTDISLSASRSPEPSSLAPWRAFGGISASFDVFAKSKAMARAKAIKDSLEREQLKETSRKLAEKARQDSIDAAEAMAAKTKDALEKELAASAMQKAMADTLARRQAELLEKERLLREKEAALAMEENERRRQKGLIDSAEARRVQDSIAMAKKLADERGKRSDLENELLKNGVANLQAVYFDNGKTTLSINSEPYLKMVGQILAKYPKLKLEIGGHTDNRGKKVANQKLSAGRAASVRTLLVETYPELAGSLKAKGYGDTKPKAPNKTEAGRLQNRRVEIKVLNPEILKEYAK
jgi:outer membrane protein OmpA-like peptidoglycan-associated protein